MRVEDVSGAWEENAKQWAAWARTPDHDVFHWQLNFRAFAELLPGPGRLTLDVGCGEGRVGRWLAGLGHRVLGIDSSPTLAALAAEAGGYEEVVCGDAARMPWEADSFDLAVAYMSLHDMPDHAGAIDEIARVLALGGVLCVAIVHPLNRVSEHVERYFEVLRFRDVVTRNGLTMTFDGVDRPLEAYTEALSASGFVIERLREPRPSAAVVAGAPALAVAVSRPYFLHLCCRLSGASRTRA